MRDLVMIRKIEIKIIWLFAVFIKTTILSYELGIMPLCYSGRDAYVTINHSVMGLFSFNRVVTIQANANQHFDTADWDSLIASKADVGKGLFK